MVLAPDPIGQERACRCGATFAVRSQVPMAEADRRCREWMAEHAKACVEMRAELAAQGGHLMPR